MLYAKDNNHHSIVNIKDMPVVITLLRNVRIQIKSDRVVEELEKIAIAEEDVKIKGRLKALDMLGKHVGLWAKKIGFELGLFWLKLGLNWVKLGLNWLCFLA